MKVGLFFGSFNPIHIGHLIIANYMANNSDLDEVWFMVTPQNPLKNQRSLLNEYDRLEMVRIAIGDNPKLRASDFEFNLPRPSFTIDTLVRLKEKHPDYQFALIMGSDTINTLPKWKNYEEIISNYEVYAYPRPEADITLKFNNLRVMENTPVMKISASFIRRSIRNKRSIQYMVPHGVFEYINKWGYYQ